MVPPGVPAGTYRVRLGVWLPGTGKRLRVTETNLPIAPRSVEIGTLTVGRPGEADRGRSRDPGAPGSGNRTAAPTRTQGPA